MLETILFVIGIIAAAVLIANIVRAKEPKQESTEVVEEENKETENLNYTETDLYYNIKGTIYRIYKTKKGSYFILRTKVRDNSLYRDYLNTEEVEKAIRYEKDS